MLKRIMGLSLCLIYICCSLTSVANAELLKPGNRVVKAKSKSSTYLVKVQDVIKYRDDFRGYTIDSNIKNAIKFGISCRLKDFTEMDRWPVNPIIKVHLQKKDTTGKWKTIETYVFDKGVNRVQPIITDDSEQQKLNIVDEYRFQLENTVDYDVAVCFGYKPRYEHKDWKVQRWGHNWWYE